MNKPILFLVAVFFFISAGYAQRYSGRSSESYGGYYTPILYGPNGFRTVEEENHLTDLAIAEARRQRHEDSAGANRLVVARKNYEDKREVKEIKKGLNNDPKESQKQNTQPVAASKPASRSWLQSFFH